MARPSSRHNSPASGQPRVTFVRPGLLIFALALFVRLLHLWQLRGSPFWDVLLGDALAYDQWAQRIAAGDWLGRDVFYQAPLYPYLLGALNTVAGHDLWIVRVCQALLGSCSCVLLAFAASRLFSQRAGVAAGGALALYPQAIFFDSLLQKSALDLFFVCLSLALLSGLLARRSTGGAWFALGLCLGGLSLTRENALVFVAVVAAWTWIVSDASQRLLRLGTVALGLAVLLVPVAARNYAVGGGVYVTTSQFGPNLYIGNNAEADGTYAPIRFGRGAPQFERQDATEMAELALGRTLSPAEVSGYWTGRATAFIRDRPGAWLRLMGRKMLLLANVSEMLDTESQESYAEWSTPLRVGGVVGHFGVLVPLAVLGLFTTWPDRRRLWVLHAMAAAYASSVVLFYVFARYRYPLVPFLILFAAPGALAAPRFWRSSTRRQRTVALASVVAAAVVANQPLLSADTMRAITETNLGTALQDQHRYADGIEHLDRAVALAPDYAPAHNNLGTALRAAGRLEDAIAAYRRALALRPDFADATYNLANALLEHGEARAAVEEFRKTLRTIPRAVDVRNNLGIALATTGDAAGAMAEFRAALAIDANSVQAHRNLGNMLADSGSTAEGLSHLRRAVVLAPDQPEPSFDLGGVLLQQGDVDGAADALRVALRARPDWAEAHNRLGIALGSLGRVDEAAEEFRRALTIDPAMTAAQRNLDLALGRFTAKPGLSRDPTRR